MSITVKPMEIIQGQYLSAEAQCSEHALPVKVVISVPLKSFIGGEEILNECHKAWPFALRLASKKGCKHFPGNLPWNKIPSLPSSKQEKAESVI